VVVCDINEERVAEFARRGFETVPDSTHLTSACDVYSPCARGAGLNDETIPKLRCKAVAGCANNQLLEPRHGRALADRDILYVPDYVANAGGVCYGGAIEVVKVSAAEAIGRVEAIYDTTLQVLERARADKVPPSDAADRLAEQRLAKAGLSAK
jgi:leucine dehydrogenase